MALQDLKGQAGTGPQRVPSQAIKDVFANDESRLVLLLLMNLCFQEGRIPASWDLAEQFVLHKGKRSLTVRGQQLQGNRSVERFQTGI
jgi:hypothetical protein